MRALAYRKRRASRVANRALAASRLRAAAGFDRRQGESIGMGLPHAREAGGNDLLCSG
jgi:hypothetical protein